MKQNKPFIVLILSFATLLFSGCEYCPYYPTPPVFDSPFFLADTSNLYAVKVVYNGKDGVFTTDINVYSVDDKGVNKIKHKTFKGSYKWRLGVYEFNYYSISPLSYNKKWVILEDTKSGYVYLYDIMEDSMKKVGKLNSSKNKCSYDHYSIYYSNTILLNSSKILEVFNSGFLGKKGERKEESCIEDYVTREEIPISHPDGVKYYYLNYDDESQQLLYSFVKGNEIIIDQLTFDDLDKSLEPGNYLGKITMETSGQPFKFITITGNFLIAQQYSFCTTHCSHPSSKLLYLYNYRESRLINKIKLDLSGIHVNYLYLMYARKVSDGIFVIFRDIETEHSVIYIPLTSVPEEIKLYPLHVCREFSYWCCCFSDNVYHFGWVGNKMFFIGDMDLNLDLPTRKCDFKGIDTFSVYRISYESSSGGIEIKEVGKVK